MIKRILSNFVLGRILSLVTLVCYHKKYVLCKIFLLTDHMTNRKVSKSCTVLSQHFLSLIALAVLKNKTCHFAKSIEETA